MKRLLALAPLLALLAACKTIEPPEPPDLTCMAQDWDVNYVETDPVIYRQGAAIRLRPVRLRGHTGTHEVPMECTSGWFVSGPATLSADRRTLSIAADAPVGSQVALAYRVGDEQVDARLRVVGRDEVVLTGTRSQSAIQGCDGLDPVRELAFGANGSFSVTFMPFETYKDYWGRYRYDPATGALSMSVTGGNYVPPGLDLEGSARLGEGGRLVLEDVYLGSRQGPPPPAAGCRYTF